MSSIYHEIITACLERLERLNGEDFHGYRSEVYSSVSLAINAAVEMSQQPKPASIQSAEEFLISIRSKQRIGNGDWIPVDEALKFIESRDAAQRQAGREEKYPEVLRVYTRMLGEMRERYAAVVELAEKVKQWSEAYPTNIFNEPTPEQAREAFEKADFTMDCFSAMVLRAFTKPWGNMAHKALSDLGNEKL